jgi:carboxyl-terminal processing protease
MMPLRAFPRFTVGSALCAALALFPGLAPAATPRGSASPGASVSRQALQYVDQLYVEPSLVNAREMLAGALRALESRYPEVIADTGDGRGTATVRIDGEELRFDFSRAKTLADAMAQLERLAAFTAPRLAAADGEGPEYGALRGALEALDPHTSLLSPAQYRGFTNSIRGAFGGIGITFSLSPEGIVVGEVLPGSAAAAAGLSTDDVIIAVGGVSAAGLTTERAMGLVRGEVGSTVALTVRPAGGGATREVPAVRALVAERSVRSRVIGGGGAPLLYIAVSRFQQETAGQLRDALFDFAPDTAGVILDLRGNPGGMLDPAVGVADLFLDSGVIVSIRGRGGRPQVFSASPFGIVERRPPLVVLINRGSASAAEVVAAALKESRAVVVGETSYGKGSVQQAYPLGDGGALLLTIKHYYTPGDVSIQARGVNPDVLLTPVVVGEKTIVGRPAAPFHPREATMRNAFAARGAADAGGPAWRVTYLRSAVPAIAGFTAPAEPRPDEDAALRTAAAILRRAASVGGDGSRRALLAAAGPVAEEVAAEEERRILAALALKGVDWAAGPAAGAGGAAPALEADISRELSLAPGATARVTVRLRNTGDRTVHRVWGRTASGNPFLANIDFVFGAIVPGEAKEATVDVEVPSAAWARWDPYDLAVQEGDGPVLGTYHGSARTLTGGQPGLASALERAEGGAEEGPVEAAAARRPPLVSVTDGPPERTTSPLLLLRLAVTDETSVKDVQVLVGGRKVFYRRAVAGAVSLPVSVDVPLAGGSNRIEVVARDGDNLSAARTFYVYLTPR